jgi:protein TonB
MASAFGAVGTPALQPVSLVSERGRMFDQTFINGRGEAKRPYTIVLSLVLQIGVMFLLILIPLIYSEVLPSAQLRSMIVAPAPPAPPPKLASSAAAQPRTTRTFVAPPLVAPSLVPKNVDDIERDVPAPEIRVAGSTGDGSGPTGSLVDSILGRAPGNPPPLLPIPTPRTRSGPVRIGGRVAQANLMRQVQPTYPPLAKSARVQGAVEFTATISKDGKIENLQLIHGHPLLVNAAKEAVLQWRYRPTLLNGQPVEVVTDIVVNFTLNP